MSTVHEGWINLELSPEQAKELADAQSAYRSNVIEETNSSRLTNALSTLSFAISVISMVNNVPPVASLAVSLIGAWADLATSEKETYAHMIQSGYNSISDIERQMGYGPGKWQSIICTVPVLKFVDYNVQVLAGTVTVDRVYVDGAWVS